ncbi:MAG: hypothetical protein HXS54_00870 [Theionarchaea archaeon]|nr:hypothetical protein [Theionarchaea archaeon]
MTVNSDLRKPTDWISTGGIIRYSNAFCVHINTEKHYECHEVFLSKKERGILELRNSLIDNITKIKDNLEDLKCRQEALSNIKDILASAKNDFRRDPPLFDLIIGLFYATKNLYSENLSCEQIDTLKAAINRINRRLTESDTNEIVETLISVGFMPLPRFSGLAEIYKRQGKI